jgi:hypothetical protein
MNHKFEFKELFDILSPNMQSHFVYAFLIKPI